MTLDEWTMEGIRAAAQHAIHRFEGTGTAAMAHFHANETDFELQTRPRVTVEAYQLAALVEMATANRFSGKYRLGKTRQTRHTDGPMKFTAEVETRQFHVAIQGETYARARRYAIAVAALIPGATPRQWKGRKP
jgi:hypothetical protein